jgi:hypothetical protein
MKFKKKAIKILLALFLTVSFSNYSFAEQYRLACKIGPFDLQGTSFADKTRLLNKVMDFDVDTEIRMIYSKDLRSSTDEVILHGLWPDAKLIGTFGKQEIAWNNEVLTSEDPWEQYRYTSFVEKKSKKQSKDERTLHVTIQTYKKRPVLGQIKKPKFLKEKKHEEMVEKLNKGEITQEEFDKFEAEQNKPLKTETVKKDTFKFKFTCIKTPLI